MKENMKIKNGGLLVIMIILIFILFLIFKLVLSYFSTFVELGNQKSDWGTFGDFIGGTLNPLLSFFGFMALLWTVHIQQKQIEDDKKNRKTEKFDRAFFELFNLHNKTLSEVLEASKLQKETNQIWKSTLEETRNLLQDKKLWKQYSRNLYTLLKFVRTSHLQTEEQNVYSTMVKLLLTDDVLFLLLIDGTSNNDFKLLIENYGLFENASFNKSDDIALAIELEKISQPAVADAMKLYDKKAFSL